MFLFKNKINNLSDHDLISLYQSRRDEIYLEELFKRYSHLVYCVCQKYLKNEEDSKDAAMEIFSKAFDSLEKYEIRNFKNWLYTITKNYCLSKIKNISHHNTVISMTVDELEKKSVENSIFNTLFNEENIDNEKVNFVLSQLNPKQRQCLELFYFRKKSYHEITIITGYELKQIKSYIQNGKRNMKKLLLKLKDEF